MCNVNRVKLPFSRCSTYTLLMCHATPGYSAIPNDHIFRADDLRSGCMKELRRIYTDMLAQNQMDTGTRLRNGLALSRLHILEELLELQEVQAAALMHAVSRGTQRVL